VLALLAAATTFHDKSKTPFFIAAGALVAWAILVSAVGIRSSRFPSSKLQSRGAMAITAVLVAFAASMAVYTSKTPPGVPPYTTGIVTNGVTPQATPLTPVSKVTSGPLKLAANPTGQLAYNTKTLVTDSTKVVIDFTNKSPIPHNVTIANAAGKVLGDTPTFAGGTKVLSLTLAPGTYTYYCSVPGHEQAGMKGTLTVRSPSTPAAPPPATNGPLALAANPTGLLAYNTTTLVSNSTKVVIDFTNKSPVPHNVTIANAAGKVLGDTPTFAGGTKVLSLTLPAGTYTYYCSVPGHEQAGMKGTLTVRSGSTAGSPPAANGALALAANPTGLLAYNTTTLTAASSKVVIDFTNKSPVPHNVTIANAAGKVLGHTPTFAGGAKVLSLTLPAGTYTYYCSVPGHEQAGMKGTLTVR
jgi:plastocyanin